MTDETEKNDMTGQETAPLMHRVYLLGEFDAARIDFVEGKSRRWCIIQQSSRLSRWIAHG